MVPVVTRAGEEDTNTAQSGDAIRVSGVSIQHTPATKIWFGQVSNTPGYRSLPHHHGEAETGGYVLRGHGRIYFGENYSEFIDMTEGDFVFVPPHMPHVEVNMSTTEAASRRFNCALAMTFAPARGTDDEFRSVC